MLIEIHMLKNYPPTNLNRDDMGMPKTCIFGGTNRSRISSQCLKRSWRKSMVFEEAVGEENLGLRTRKLPFCIGEQLRKQGVSEEYISAIMPQLSAIGNKDSKENKKNPEMTAQIAMYSYQDIDDIAQVVKLELEKCKSVADVKKIKAKDMQANIKNAEIRPISLDIALFGRMVTSDAFRNVEAAVQVAHALSTNRVVMESDYFVAMDDLVSGKSQDDAGAAMIDSTEYNSSCYYIYASIDTDILSENLEALEEKDALVSKAVKGMLEAMAFSDPNGKQHAFAGHVLPSFALVECKDRKIPVSYTNAFARAVYPTDNKDLICRSIEALLNERKMLKEEFSLVSRETFQFCSSKYLEETGEQEGVTKCQNYEEMIQKVLALLV